MEDLDYAVNDLREDLAAYVTGRVEDQSVIRRVKGDVGLKVQ
jgi:hypothetical protein